MIYSTTLVINKTDPIIKPCHSQQPVSHGHLIKIGKFVEYKMSKHFIIGRPYNYKYRKIVDKWAGRHSHFIYTLKGY